MTLLDFVLIWRFDAVLCKGKEPEGHKTMSIATKIGQELSAACGSLATCNLASDILWLCPGTRRNTFSIFLSKNILPRPCALWLQNGSGHSFPCEWLAMFSPRCKFGI